GAALVRAPGPSKELRPLLPLRGQQPRRTRGPGPLSALDRAAIAALRPVAGLEAGGDGGPPPAGPPCAGGVACRAHAGAGADAAAAGPERAAGAEADRARPGDGVAPPLLAVRVGASGRAADGGDRLPDARRSPDADPVDAAAGAVPGCVQPIIRAVFPLR